MRAAMTGSSPAVAASRTAGIAEMIGPMIGTSSRIPAVTDSRIAYRPNTGSTSWLSTDQADEREHADRDPEDELRPDPLAEDPPADAQDGPDVEPPRRGQASIELAGQHAPVLEDVEHPDREQQVAEDRPDEAARTRQDREEDREVDRGRASLALGDARDHRSRCSRGARRAVAAGRRSPTGVRSGVWSCTVRAGKSWTNRTSSLTRGVRVRLMISTMATIATT